MSTVIDLPRITRALAELDRIAVEHPEICHKGQPWTKNLNTLEKVLMTSGKTRIAEYRARQAAKGLKTINVFLTPEAQAALNRLQSERPESTMGEIISDALVCVVATKEQSP